MNQDNLDSNLRKVIIFFGLLSVAFSTVFGIFPIVFFVVILVQVFSFKNKKLSTGTGKITWSELWEEIKRGSINNSQVEDNRDAWLGEQKASLKNWQPSINDNLLDYSTDPPITNSNYINSKNQPYKIEKTSKKWLVVIFFMVLLLFVLIYLNDIVSLILSYSEISEIFAY